FDFLQDSKGGFDIVVVDPPAFATSRSAVEKARVSYEKVFSEAARQVRPGGLLALSSCSRPVDFDIFYEIVIASLSKARRIGQLLSISGQPFDHPFPHICPELRYLKFFLMRLD
ncbi:MAG: class I SAM-dependent rRNA methyltransferase, partial [Pseudomonadota bacterium]